MEKKHYLSKEGLKKVEERLAELKLLRQEKLEGEGPKAFHFGDIEPDFLAFREEMAQLEKEIAETEEILSNHILIKKPGAKYRDVVALGAVVTVEVDGDRDEFMIVGSFEANPALGRISNECAVGSALLGHKVGDEVVINSSVKTVYKIIKINYA